MQTLWHDFVLFRISDCATGANGFLATRGAVGETNSSYRLFFEEKVIKTPSHDVHAARSGDWWRCYVAVLPPPAATGAVRGSCALPMAGGVRGDAAVHRGGGDVAAFASLHVRSIPERQAGRSSGNPPATNLIAPARTPPKIAPGRARTSSNHLPAAPLTAWPRGIRPALSGARKRPLPPLLFPPPPPRCCRPRPPWPPLPPP